MMKQNKMITSRLT